jgi:hypothetical protein
VKSNDEIWNLINTHQFKEADIAIRERLAATNLTEPQASALMYYAYERGHSSGEHEVLNFAMELLTSIAEAK